MNIHILGLGAIGTLLAHHLRLNLPKETHRITLIHRTTLQATSALQRGGTISGEQHGVKTVSQGYIFERADLDSDKLRQSSPRPIETDRVFAADAGSKDRISTLFVATKTYNTIPAIQQLLHRLNPHCTIVLMQNGMGIYEKLVENVFLNPVTRPKFILGVNTHGSYLREVSDVVHCGVGKFQYSIVPDRTSRELSLNLDPGFHSINDEGNISDIPYASFPEYVSLYNTMAALQALRGTQFSSKWVSISRLQFVMMRKLVANAVINPLSAIMNCRNGDLFLTDASMRILRRVCQEASAVFEKQIIAELKERERAEIHSEDETAIQEFWDRVGRFPRILTSTSLEEECLDVAQRTASNLSSMLIDVRKGNQTEIDSINGYLLGLGKKYSVPMPATAVLLNLVKMRTSISLDQKFS